MNASLLDPKPAAVALRTRAHKFGGSSLADAGRIAHVAGLLLAGDEARQITVVSAMQGVTNALIALTQAACAGREWRADWQALYQRHASTAAELVPEQGDSLQSWLTQEFGQLAGLLDAVAVLGSPGRPTLERIQGLGEVWSARLLRAHLAERGANYGLIDARDVLHVQPGELGVAVDWPRSQAALAQWRVDHPQARCIATGFVACGPDGLPTVLGRNGSDYSGAIFAALFEADELHIWTDVDGVLSADPRLVPEAVPLPALSYREA
ncbi:MAG: bifunctional aspartate kinase/homoserine dehydrogenase I, partial [Arenimonas sp.]|nr:bifunctional aspartate kinase/homoserine dehydrogenase I [Arenimonas sp.]